MVSVRNPLFYVVRKIVYIVLEQGSYYRVAEWIGNNCLHFLQLLLRQGNAEYKTHTWPQKKKEKQKAVATQQ